MKEIEERKEYETIEEAVKVLKLDRRHKWFELCGELVRSENYTIVCTGCDGGGCHECGYKGKRRSGYPVPAFDKEGKFVYVKPNPINL